MEIIDIKQAYGYFTRKKRMAENSGELFAIQDYETALYCINKQIKSKINGKGECPSCRKTLLLKSNYCPNCGQRLESRNEI